MARWLYVAVCLVLFTATMWVVGMIVNATVPGVRKALEGWIGLGGAWAVLLAALTIAGLVGYWPRDDRGKYRRLRSPWD